MTVREHAHFLTVHARWAAEQHEAFADCAAEIRDLRASLERVTQRTRHRVEANARCFDCRGRLWRNVDEVTGLEDERVTCDQCGEQYDPSRYHLALSSAAAEAAWVEVDGETWGTPSAIAHELQRPENTLHRWRRDGLVRHLTIERVLFFAVADVRAEHESRGMRRVG